MGGPAGALGGRLGCAWCVCQDNNPGTRNLEFGHTVVKMKCAASRVMEHSDGDDDDDDCSVEGSELCSRTKGGDREEQKTGKTGHGTGMAVTTCVRVEAR